MEKSKLIINLKIIEDNIREIKKIIGKDVEIAPVIKDNAYGHGLIEIAQLLNEVIEINYIIVSNLIEAQKIIKEGINKEIITLRPLMDNELQYLEEKIHVTITDKETLMLLEEYCIQKNININIHLKVETGFSRFGINSNEINWFIQLIEQSTHLYLEGIWTHLSDSDDKEYTDFQVKNLFENPLVAEMRKSGVKIHVASSKPIMNKQENLFFDLVRPGLLTYGLISKKDSAIKQALQWESSLIEVKNIKRNSRIGYGRDTIIKEDSKIAIIPVGFFSGYPRIAKNCEVLVSGTRAEILGNIFMDYMIIDCTNIKDIEIGNKVILTGEDSDNGQRLYINELANKSNLIPNDFICNVGNRFKREYKY